MAVPVPMSWALNETKHRPTMLFTEVLVGYRHCFEIAKTRRNLDAMLSLLRTRCVFDLIGKFPPDLHKSLGSALTKGSAHTVFPKKEL